MLVGLPSTRQALTRGVADPQRPEGEREPESKLSLPSAAASPSEPTTAPETPNNDADADLDTGPTPRAVSEPASVGRGPAPISKSALRMKSDQVELSPAEQAAFSNALAKHGKKWKVIADEYGFFGGSVAQTISYFNENKERYQKHLSVEADTPPKDKRRSADDLVKLGGSTREKITSEARSKKERPLSSPRKSGDGGDEPRKAIWTQDEMAAVEQHFRDYGKDWKKISRLMRQKTPQQVKGYWKTKHPQERDSSGSKKKRHRSKSSQSSPPPGKGVSVRSGGPASGKDEQKDAARDHSRKRDAGDAKLSDRRPSPEKRERVGDETEPSSPRAHKKETGESETPPSRKINALSSPKHSGGTEASFVPVRIPLRSKPAPELGSVKQSSKAVADDDKERARSSS